MCGYLGKEIVEHARRIRDLQTDLAELVRQDEKRGREQIKAARRVLAGDEGALRVLEETISPPAPAGWHEEWDRPPLMRGK